MLRLLFFTFFSFFTLNWGQCAFSQMYTNPTSIQTHASKIGSAFFSLDTIEYENGSTKTDFEVERKVLGLEIATDTKQNFGLVGQFTFSPDVKYPDGGDGSGYSIAGGVRGKFDRTQKGTVYLAGYFSYLKDDVDYASAVGKIDVDTTITELVLQATYATPMGSKVNAYGTIDLIPMVDGELKSSPGGKADIERDDIIRLRVGSNIFTSGYIIRPELAFVGGQAFTISVAKSI